MARIELITNLHQERASRAPMPPADVVAALAQFEPGVESPRHEWFLARYGVPLRKITRAVELARISSPANGMVIAIDPDIPPSHQRVPLSVAGASAQMRLQLDGRTLAAATTPTLWTPRPGAHTLELRGGSGEVLDRVVFTVR